MHPNKKILQAVKDLSSGKPVLIFDFDERERETDIVFLAEKVTHNSIRILRKDAGGLICVAVHDKIAEALHLPFLRELLRQYTNDLESLFTKPLPYDEKSSFSITINHIKTFTGITDRDRALTVSRFGQLCNAFWHGKIDTNALRNAFISEFRAPGHVFLLRASKGLVLERQGHTELSLSLALLGNLAPCTVIAEMLGDDGYSLTKEKAQEYAKKHGYVFLTGNEIIKAFKQVFGEHQ